MRGSKQIYFALVLDGIWSCIKVIGRADDSVLEYYLENSYGDAAYFDRTLPVQVCVSELPNAKTRFKDVLADTISNSDLYEV